MTERSTVPANNHESGRPAEPLMATDAYRTVGDDRLTRRLMIVTVIICGAVLALIYWISLIMVSIGTVEIELGNLQAAATAESDLETEEIILEVLPGPKWVLNGEPMTLEGVEVELSAKNVEAEAAGQKLLVTLQAQDETNYQEVIHTLEALARIHVSNVTFHVEEEWDD